MTPSQTWQASQEKIIMTKQIDVDHLAKLAKLPVSEKEKEKLTDQLEKTVDYIEVLDELETSQTEPTFQVTGQTNVSRQDESEDCLSQKKALENAPRKKNGYFVIKKIKWGN